MSFILEPDWPRGLGGRLERRSGTGDLEPVGGGGVWLDATLQSTATSIHHPIEEEDTCFFLFGFVLFLFFSFLFFFFLVAVFRHRDAADVGGFRRSFVSRESDRWRCESNGLMPSSHTHTHTHTHKHTDGLVNNSLTEIKITRCRPEMDGSDRR